MNNLIIAFVLLFTYTINVYGQPSAILESKVSSILNEIMTIKGINNNIVLRENPDIQFAEAEVSMGTNYLYYNPDAFGGLLYLEEGEREWSLIFILAHEVGHFFQEDNDEKLNELNADKFAGSVLCAMKAPINEVEIAITIHDLKANGSYVSKSTRRIYARKGWEGGCSIEKVTSNKARELEDFFETINKELEEKDYYKKDKSIQKIVVKSYSSDGNPLSTYTDSRDNRTYNIVKIANKWWFAEELKFDSPNSKCPYDLEKYCGQFGRYYQFEDALQMCPRGWHLPKFGEWVELLDHYGGYFLSTPARLDGSNAYNKLIIGGESGFNAKLTGRVNSGYHNHLKVRGSYWVNQFSQNGESFSVSGIMFDGRDDPRDPKRVFLQNYLVEDHYMPCRCIEN